MVGDKGGRNWPPFSYCGAPRYHRTGGVAPTVPPAALDSSSVDHFVRGGSDETDLLATKPFLVELRRRLETMLGYPPATVFQTTGFDHARAI
jgi:hypothetical protein